MSLHLPDAPAARRAFLEQHALAVPGGAGADVLREARVLMRARAWGPDEVTGSAFAFDVLQGDLGELPALLTGPTVLGALERLTGVRGVEGFVGQIKRLRPGGRFPWHRDHRKGQKLGVSIALSDGFHGGAFAMRWRWERDTLCRVEPGSIGDLHLIDVADERLVHRVEPVTSGERVFLAGWWVG